jgi:hypothetical protein
LACGVNDDLSGGGNDGYNDRVKNDEMMHECLKCLNEVKSFASAAAISASSAAASAIASNESSSIAAISASSSTASAVSASNYSDSAAASAAAASAAAASAAAATASAAVAASYASDSINSHTASADSATAVDDAMNVLCSINQTDSAAFNVAASRFVELYMDSSASSSDEKTVRPVRVVKGKVLGKPKN